MRIRQEVEFWIEPRVEKDGTMWSAYCDELGMATCGITREEAEENLVKTLQTLMRVLRRRGILEQTLESVGIEFKTIETERMRVVA